MKLRSAKLADGSSVPYVEVPNPPTGAMKRTYFTPDGSRVVQFFHDHSAGKDPLRRKRLEAVVGKYNPTTDPVTGAYWQELFCWPVAVVVEPSLGVVCPAYPKHFFFDKHPVPGETGSVEKKGRWFFRPPLRKLLGVKDRGDLQRFLLVAARTARAVRRLHAAGLAHSDLSYNNVLIDPESGRVIVTDMDSLVVPGLYPPDVLGTKGYIAPEVLASASLPTGDPGRKLPDARTDQHALAVMVYEYLLQRHPLDGPKIHDRAGERDEFLAYGPKALYIEHPSDRSNRPRDLSLTTADLGPGLAGLFRQAFVDGLHTPDRRPSALEWERELVRAFDQLHPCENASCERKWFIAHGPGVTGCPACRAPLHGQVLALTLMRPGPSGPVADGRLVVHDGLCLYRWHVAIDHSQGETADLTPCGYFGRSQGKWVFVNQRLGSLTVAGSPPRLVPLGSMVELTPGIRLRFSDQPTGRWAEVAGGPARQPVPRQVGRPPPAVPAPRVNPSPPRSRQAGSAMNASLKTLQTLFADRPDVVRMLNRRELDVQELTDAGLIATYQTHKLYPEPVNLYVTGRTGAGKSSLGNRFLAGSPLPSPLSSTGYQNCTWVVQFFQLASNLVYFDLPGSGSSDVLENVNRAALLIKQLQDEEEGLAPADAVPVLDFTRFVTTGQAPVVDKDTVKIPLAEWHAGPMRQRFAPDVILYVVSPHTGWFRNDRKYLRDLLRTRKEAQVPANVVFALNLFRNEDGTLKPTDVNRADVRKLLTEDWKTIHPGESPTIIEVNARTGAGLQALAEAMCQLLPPQKITNMGAALTEDLRKAATAERSRRFHQLLIQVAARLATFKVDATAGRDELLQIAFTALCSYAIEVFHEEAAWRDAQREAVAQVAGGAAEEAREERVRSITVTHTEVVHEEKAVEELSTPIPEYEDEVVEEEVATFTEAERQVGRSALSQTATGLFEGMLHVALSPIGLVQSLFGSSRTVHDEIRDDFRSSYTTTERYLQPGTRTVSRLRQRLKGFRQDKVMVNRLVPTVVSRQEQVGTEYLTGGSRVIEDVLALGLALEHLPSGTDLSAGFEQAVSRARLSVREKLAPLAARLDAAASANDPASAEAQLIALLTPVFLK
jgi:hypothetical protein